MFQELFALVQSNKSVNLILTATGDEMTVVVLPQPNKDEAALKTPLSLTATPADLDQGFADAIARFTGGRKSLEEQLADTEAVLAAAKKESAQKATKAVKKAGGSPAPQGLDAEDDESLSDESDESATGAPNAVPVSAANLFD